MKAIAIFVALFLVSSGAYAIKLHNQYRIEDLGVKADPETTTPNNCTCRTVCSCGPDCDTGNPISWYPESSTLLGEVRDWCETEDNCGQFSLTRGYWDYCLFKFQPQDEFVSKTWEEKTDFIMESVMMSDTEYDDVYMNMGYSVEDKDNSKVMTTAEESMFMTMENEWDTFPPGREKLKHDLGVVCKFTLDIKESQFSGIFKDGNRTGIIRLSVGGGKQESAGAAIKFLRTGVPSGNLLVHHLPGQEASTTNFFDLEINILYNHRNGMIWDLERYGGMSKFKQGSAYAAAVGLSDLARYDQDGNEEYPIFPFKVALKPTGKINFSNVKLPDDCYLRQFTENIPNGTELYSFIAYADPQDVIGTELATMVIVDKCYLSKYGDEKLFFRHQRVEEDIELKPEWKNDYMLIEFV